MKIDRFNGCGLAKGYEKFSRLRLWTHKDIVSFDHYPAVGLLFSVALIRAYAQRTHVPTARAAIYVRAPQ